MSTNTIGISEILLLVLFVVGMLGIHGLVLLYLFPGAAAFSHPIFVGDQAPAVWQVLAGLGR